MLLYRYILYLCNARKERQPDAYTSHKKHSYKILLLLNDFGRITDLSSQQHICELAKRTSLIYIHTEQEAELGFSFYFNREVMTTVPKFNKNWTFSPETKWLLSFFTLCIFDRTCQISTGFWYCCHYLSVEVEIKACFSSVFGVSRENYLHFQTKCELILKSMLHSSC